MTSPSSKSDYLDCYFPSFHRIAATAVEPVVKRGYLTKQGGRIATWKRRWCVLAGGERGTLYYYVRCDDLTPKGFIPLSGCEIVRLQSKKKFSFVIKHAQRRHFFINCDTESGMSRNAHCFVVLSSTHHRPPFVLLDLYAWLLALQNVIDQQLTRERAQLDSLWRSLDILSSRQPSTSTTPSNRLTTTKATTRPGATEDHNNASASSSKSNSASNTPPSSLTKKQVAALDDYVPWRSLLTATGARSLVDAQRFAIRYLFFSTVLALDDSSDFLRNVDLFDLRNVTRQQTEFFSDVFGEFANILATAVELSNCYHGAIDRMHWNIFCFILT
jgi:hypothetical protein